MEAEGVGTHAPAFEGTITVVLAGQAFEVPVVAVDDTVYAQLPLTVGWQDIDPAEYGAPDPAQLMSPDAGFSSLLPETTDVEEGESVRGGEDNSEVLTEYTGTVSGDVVKNIIPTASGDFDATYTITDDGELREADADRRLLRGLRVDDLHRDLRRLRHREGHHRAMTRSPRLLLGLAAVAVAFAAADTYVVVLALPDMMASAGIPVDQLQRAAPIVSGFLLGYVAMLPLIGRIADLRGRVPVLVAALVVFALGSLVTTLAYDMPTMVTGRFLQGVGGGGLVPATLALVADLYPAAAPRRPARRRLRRPGARQRGRPAVRRAGAGRRRLAGDLPDQPGRRARARRRDPQLALGGSSTRAPASVVETAASTGSASACALVAFVAGVLVFVRAHAADARPDLGPAVHPDRRRRPLADPARA